MVFEKNIWTHCAWYEQVHGSLLPKLAVTQVHMVHIYYVVANVARRIDGKRNELRAPQWSKRLKTIVSDQTF